MLKRYYFVLLVCLFFTKAATAQTSQLDSLESLLQNHLQKDTVRVNLLNEIAYKIIGSDINKTLSYSEEALKLSEMLSFLKGKAESLRLIGIYYIIKAEYSKALEYYQQSLAINKEIGYEVGMANALNNIGLIYYTKSDYPRALDYYHQSLSINEKIKDENGIQKALSNIGIVYWLQSDYTEAVEYIRKALKINQELGYKPGTSNCLINVGNIYMAQKKFSEALEYYQKALVINEELQDARLISDCLTNIGLAQMSIGNYSEALINNQKALKMRTEIGNRRDIGLTLSNLSRIFLKMKNIENALDHGLRALEIANDLNIIELKKDVVEALSQIYAASNDYKKAYNYHLSYKALSDSVLNEKNIKETTNLENQYAFDKEKQAIAAKQAKKDAIQIAEMKWQKQLRNAFVGGAIIFLILTLIILRNLIQKRKANKLLEEQKEEIKTQAEELQTINEELVRLSDFKEDMTHMMVHDLKAPLGTIINAKIIKNEENRFNLMLQAGYRMLNLVQNILDVYKYENVAIELNRSDFDLSDATASALIEVSALIKQKSINLNLGDGLQSIINADKEIMIRVFANLLSNAVKYSPINGDVKIDAVIENKDIRFGISNQGKGIPKEKQKEIFERFKQNKDASFQQKGSTGLGLTFCKMAIEAHGGQIGVISETEIGVEFWFTIPDSYVSESDTNVQIEEEMSDSISLSTQNKEYLKQFVEALRKYEIFEISAINNVIKDIDVKNNQIKAWITKLEEIIYLGDMDAYEKHLLLEI